MEIQIDTIINIASLLLGGGGGAIFTWRWMRKKAQAEAAQAETTAAKEMQDMYQQMIRDKGEEVADKNRIISELRQDRDHFRQDRNELRERIDKTEETVRNLQREVARNGRMVENMRPFVCTKAGCKHRQRVDMSVAEDNEQHLPVLPQTVPAGTTTADIEEDNEPKTE